MTVALSSEAAQSGYLKIRVVGIAAAAGLVGAIPNPEGQLLQVVEGWFHLITPSAAAATLNVGIGASAVADYTDIVAAFPANGGANTAWTVLARGASEAAATGAQNGSLWAAANFLTVTSAAAACPALVGDLYLRYLRLSAA